MRLWDDWPHGELLGRDRRDDHEWLPEREPGGEIG
jgi:hypothetical protein